MFCFVLFLYIYICSNNQFIRIHTCIRVHLPRGDGLLSRGEGAVMTTEPDAPIDEDPVLDCTSADANTSNPDRGAMVRTAAKSIPSSIDRTARPLCE
jgi:hypothetical protein